MNAIAELKTRLMRAWAPPAPISTAEWADRYAVLSPETSAQPGKWHTRSYQREPLEATSDPAVRRVVIKAATQLLKTTVIKHAIARAIDVDPGPIMVLEPRKEDAREFADDHIAPMIRDTERLRGKVRLSKNGKSPKQFRGGRLIITSAGAAANLAGKAIRYLFADEVDKYGVSADDEGNPISLARKRLVTFRHQAKEIDTCSPTIEGSEIDRAYASSDQREFYIPCPLCGSTQSLMGKWTRVRWDETLPTREEQAFSARYYCEACDQPWDDHLRWAAVERGRWQANQPFNGVAGFWISELYSLDRRLWQIVLDYLLKKDSPADLKTFINTTLAENWLDKGEAPEWRALIERQEEYPVGLVPRGALILTAGADIHPDRIECEVVGWGPSRESWSIEYHIFDGNTADLVGTPDRPSVWTRLQALLAEVYPVEGGGEMTVTLLFVDSGNQTNDVYQWVRMQQPSARICAIKGTEKGHNVGQPTPVDVTVGGRLYRGGLKYRSINVATFKEELYRDLKQPRPTADELVKGWRYPTGYCHFPKGLNYGDEHFKQLCAEQLVTLRDRRGRIRREWQQLRARNEALDCRIYARAAAWALGIDAYDRRPHKWKELEDRRGPQQPGFELSPPAGQLPEAAVRMPDGMPALTRTASLPAAVAAADWLGGRGENWF